MCTDPEAGRAWHFNICLRAAKACRARKGTGGEAGGRQSGRALDVPLWEGGRGTCPEGGRAHGRPALVVSGRARHWCQGWALCPASASTSSTQLVPEHESQWHTSQLREVLQGAECGGLCGRQEGLLLLAAGQCLRPAPGPWKGCILCVRILLLLRTFWAVGEGDT